MNLRLSSGDPGRCVPGPSAEEFHFYQFYFGVQILLFCFLRGSQSSASEMVFEKAWDPQEPFQT